MNKPRYGRAGMKVTALSVPHVGAKAILTGTPIRAPATSLADDVIIERQSVLPAKFECVACGLKIRGLSRLTAVGLGDRFTSTIRYSPAEFYSLEPEWEDDFNEY